MIHQRFEITYEYNLHFTTNLFDPENTILRDELTSGAIGSKKKTRAAFAIDDGLLSHFPDVEKDIKTYFAAFSDLELIDEMLILPGGEAVKNDLNLLFKGLEFIDQLKLDRHSYLIAIGGGAVLDMVGLLSAIGHRGIRHIRIPTTVLSQNDSGVGVKNGINFNSKKNFIGTFAPPVAVINDNSFLTTLHERDWRSGIPEAIKVSLLKDPDFFQWIEKNVDALNSRNLDTMSELVERCAVLHLDHIRTNGDPFEKGSSRPLDFGHWAAHKLEQITDFNIRHGEAVAIGLALDNLYAYQMGMLQESECQRILNTLSDLGFDLFHHALLNSDQDGINPELIKGLEEFREHLGGELTIILLEGIGKSVEVHTMDHEKIESSLLYLKEHFQNSYGNS